MTEEKTKPNVLWIGLDQIRYDTIGYYGNQFCKTPSIDRLAENSVNFSRAYTTCSLCTPARASMFTGQYAFRHGMGTNCDMYHSLADELPDPSRLLHHHFLDAGYRCGYAGKWHVGTEKGPGDYGFEGMNLPGYGNIQADDGFTTYLKENSLSFKPVPEIFLNPDRQTLIGGRWGGPQESTPAHYLANYTMDMIDSFTSSADPFFVTCQFWGPHGPHMPSDEFYGLHDRDTLPPWVNFDEDPESKPRRIKRERDSFYRNHPKDWDAGKEIAGLYYDCTSMIDLEIGRLIDSLKEKGLVENTIVVLSTDHGDMTGAHGGLIDKGLPYEEVHHIPLLFYWKGKWNTGFRSDLALNMDIMPTLMDLCGIDLPDDIDGKSLVPALSDLSDRKKRENVLLEFHGLRFLYSQRAIVTDDGWKYIFTPGDYDEVYNLKEDPAELRNLIDNPASSGKVADLRDQIRKATADAGDPLRDCVSKFFGIWSTGSGQIDASRFFDKK
ncbi:MAG: sulfatase-like hydrolase/transferase [Bacteroidetes bacterium]|nr:sulfatase-like hydrolase/transferase [Bacteroidota bacterium]